LQRQWGNSVVRGLVGAKAKCSCGGLGCSNGSAEESSVAAKGEPVDDEVKTKAGAAGVTTSSSVPVAFTVSTTDVLPLQDAKAKCATPTPAPSTFPLGPASAARIAGMAACTWGITYPDPLEVRTEAVKDGADWRLCVKSVTSNVRCHSRLLPGPPQVEPTTANATSGNFCTQVGELDVLGTCSGKWYMLNAVRAHEAVHVNEWKTSFPTDWPAVQAKIEGITVPASGITSLQGVAHFIMRASTEYHDAIQTNATNFPTFWGIPDPNANTNAAEHAVVDPRIDQICNHAKAQGWNPGGCGVCSGRGIS
ncbi:MAG: hypothetical protein M3N52_00845, partial [Actinomycetota bacterium]|nr:hypothetical protein [Actinomycetota bacterium]